MADPIIARIPAVAAGGALTQVMDDEGARSTGGAAVAAVHFVPDTAQAAQGVTNFATLQVRHVRGGAPQETIATLNLGTVALVAETPVDFVLTAESQWNAGDVVDVTVVQTGTGGAVPAGLVEAELG